ncbi:25981_t:CDS:2 [Dentiscutata erythropus]|uniref:25981_t:CDS:1 n=1 Tax=Dentiscutata erythropus TaxID=1348616 RepID=A0A9N9GFK8_9GLOM|nr:25981_t:CDS:2 [Dentiscutata erythropus]
MSKNLRPDQDQHRKKKNLRCISHRILKSLCLPYNKFKLHHDQKYRQREEEVTLPGPVLTHHMVTSGVLAMDQITQEQLQLHDEIWLGKNTTPFR